MDSVAAIEPVHIEGLRHYSMPSKPSLNTAMGMIGSVSVAVLFEQSLSLSGCEIAAVLTIWPVAVALTVQVEV